LDLGAACLVDAACIDPKPVNYISVPSRGPGITRTSPCRVAVPDLTISLAQKGTESLNLSKASSLPVIPILYILQGHFFVGRSPSVGSNRIPWELGIIKVLEREGNNVQETHLVFLTDKILGWRCGVIRLRGSSPRAQSKMLGDSKPIGSLTDAVAP
jgi:hypothetical protein